MDVHAGPAPESFDPPRSPLADVNAAEQCQTTREPNPRALICNLGSQIGSSVHLTAMVEAVRGFKHHAFVILRDRSGSIQSVVNKDTGIALPSPGAFVEVSGNVVPNRQARSGYELSVTALNAISTAQDTPVFSFDRPIEASLDFQLDNRAVALRNRVVQAAFRIQARVGSVFRSTFEEMGFVEIHSPKIVAGGTEGGAEVFKIDYFGGKASLAQSPQLYKQIAAAAFERVYEIGPVFRAETSHTNRHLTEFTGLDYEMALIKDQHDVMDAQERFIRNLVSALREHDAENLALLGAALPAIERIPRISWVEANALIERHGTRSPDVTFDKSVGDAVKHEFGADFVFVFGYPEAEKPFYIMPSSTPGFTESFDLLYQGLEISSGGQRVHSYDQLVERMVERGLRIEDNPGYLQAYRAGMPPHGGSGMGLERLAQRLTGLPNVRQVTLFPRDVKRVLP